jgi:prevent-host-death family protein
MLPSKIMEVPITQFRQRLFDLVNQALEGKEIWVSHKGRRVRIVPEDVPSKLSRVTPMDIIAPGVDIDDESWKTGLMREWEQKWDRRLGPLSKPVRSAPANTRADGRRARRKA